MSLAINPWAKLSKQQINGYLKGTNSTDQDVLFSKKEEILTFAKLPKTIGLVGMVLGVLLTLTMLLAMLGIPMIAAGWWARSRGIKNIALVESSYHEYLRGLAA